MFAHLNRNLKFNPVKDLVTMSGVAVDFTRFNRHLLRSKLNWRVSHEESQIPSGIQS